MLAFVSLLSFVIMFPDRKRPTFMAAPVLASHLSTQDILERASLRASLAQPKGPSTIVRRTAAPVAVRAPGSDQAADAAEAASSSGSGRLVQLAPTGRASRTRALQAASDQVAALRELQQDFYSAGSVQNRASQLSTWMTFHAAWFGPAVPAFPLTCGKLQALAAMFKRGGYRSWPN